MITDNSDARNVSNKAVGKFASSFVNQNSCDTSFVDGVTFSYNAGYRPESKTTRVFRPVRQVAAPPSRREYLINRSKRYDCCHEIGTRWIDRSALAMSVIPSNVTSRLVRPLPGRRTRRGQSAMAARWTPLDRITRWATTTTTRLTRVSISPHHVAPLTSPVHVGLRTRLASVFRPSYPLYPQRKRKARTKQ